MIRELLSKQYLVNCAAELLEAMPEAPAIPEPPAEQRRGTPARDLAGPVGWVPLSDDDREYAAACLRRAARESVDAGLEESDRRGPDDGLPSEAVYIGRDPILSNLQTALEMAIEAYAPTHIRTLEAVDDDRRGGPAEFAVTDRELALPAEPRWDPERRLFNQFSVTDPRWVASLFAMGVRMFREPHRFNANPAPPRRLSDDARLILVGDWGTGLPRALEVAALVPKLLEDAHGRERHVIHLGDVYYSGWEHEYRERFLRWWPVASDDAVAIGSWTLNGNHDMYSGGHGYFQTALGDPRFARQKDENGLPTSTFSLEGKHWTLLGLDTAWDDHGLRDPQQSWALSRIRASSAKCLLLSHHQPMSVFEPVAADNALRRKIQPVLDTGRVRAWFWGHEHRAVSYKPIEGVPHPWCLGHGGVPVYASGAASPPEILWEQRSAFASGLGGLEHWLRFGLAVLDFKNGTIEVTHVGEDGEETRLADIS